MDKQIKKQDGVVDFKYTIGSNSVVVNGDVKYLDIIVWQEITYDDIKNHIV